jgi:DNA-binding IclR family transcriptional regulator
MMLKAFRRQGYSFYQASGDSAQQSKIDALSLPVYSPEKSITAVVTLLSMPGELAKADLDNLLKEMRKTARFCGDMMV